MDHKTAAAQLASENVAFTIATANSLVNYVYTVDYLRIEDEDDENPTGFYVYVLAAPGTLPVSHFGPYETAQAAADAALEDAREAAGVYAEWAEQDETDRANASAWNLL